MSHDIIHSDSRHSLQETFTFSWISRLSHETRKLKALSAKNTGKAVCLLLMPGHTELRGIDVVHGR